MSFDQVFKSFPSMSNDLCSSDIHMVSNDYASSSEQLSNVTGTAAEPSSPVYLFDCQRGK